MTAAPNFKIAVKANAIIGESPVWSARRNRLLWIDIMGSQPMRMATLSRAKLRGAPHIGIYHMKFIDYSIHVRSITLTTRNRWLSGARDMHFNESKDDFMPLLSRRPGPGLRAVLTIALLLVPQISFAQSCKVDFAAVEKSIAKLEPSYANVLSDISCDDPTVKAHQLMCDSLDEYPAGLWHMGRLDDLAWVYASENATKQEVDQRNPPRDAGFIAKRDACSDAACLCDLLIRHTNDSLGGESPYSAP